MSRDAVAPSSLMAHGVRHAHTAPKTSDVAVLAPPRRRFTRDQVMNAGEVAQLLHLPASTPYYLARRGEIAACRLGRARRSGRPRIEELLGSWWRRTLTNVGA